MGELRINICDVCNQEQECGFAPLLRLRGVEIKLIDHKVPVWFQADYLVGLRLEMCDSCHGKIVGPIQEAIDTIIGRCKPGYEPLPVALVVPKGTRGRRGRS